MITLKVPGMHCEKCVERITNALTKADLKFTVSLEDKTVVIDGCDGCAAKAIDELDDLGFEAERAHAETC